jgi:uncharacterized protein YjbI with pentapeptide repeats
LWNAWRLKNETIPPDLRGADLIGADLSRANLSLADLSRANLSLADLRVANLNLADLSFADLNGANLGGADLSGANLSDADLGGASLIDANLTKANLSGADLSGANLIEADLSLADLSGAHLYGANLNETDLNGANLSGAYCGMTSFANNDLSGTRGLDTVEHLRGSSIGLDTFFKSEGKIPKVFLRGAGVADIFIEHAASLTGADKKFYSCFISYSHADQPFARRLHDALQDRGVRCWLDEKQLLPGDHLHREVDEAVRLWDKVLLCASKSSLNSWWVDKEISKALKKEEQLWKERGKQVLAIIPLNLDGHMLDPLWQNWKKQHLTDRVAADFTGWEQDRPKFESQLELVIKAVRADAGARQPPPAPRL